MQEQFAAGPAGFPNARRLCFNTAHDRVPSPLLLLVLRVSEAAGGGRIAIGLANLANRKNPESRQRTWRLFCAAGKRGPEGTLERDDAAPLYR